MAEQIPRLIFRNGMLWLVAIALAVSVVGSFFGLFFSVHYDFPAGSSVVAILSVVFFIAVGIRLLTGKKLTLEGADEQAVGEGSKQEAAELPRSGGAK